MYNCFIMFLSLLVVQEKDLYFKEIVIALLLVTLRLLGLYIIYLSNYSIWVILWFCLSVFSFRALNAKSDTRCY